MNPARTNEDTFLTLAIGLGAWAGGVGAAALAGVFAKVSPGAFAALAVFATLFAAGAYLLDAGLRDFMKRRSTRALAASALLLDALIGIAFLPALQDSAQWAPILISPAGAMVVLFAVPVAAAVHTALVDRGAASPRALRSPDSKSPDGSPAAT